VNPQPASTHGPASTNHLKILVLLEQTLGHVTHSRNLQRLFPTIEDVTVTCEQVPFDFDGFPKRVLGFGNWTIRAGIRGNRIVRKHRGPKRPDVMIVHTQVPAVLLGRSMSVTPTVVSLDATPKQYDDLGEHYAHATGPAAVERVKTWLNRRCYERAEHLVVWADWTKQSLVADYGIAEDKITVIPPGVDTEVWAPVVDPAEQAPEPDDVVRILFVGGDLERKGGLDLLHAFEALRRERGDTVELHLVTTSAVTPSNGVTVYSDLTSNSPDLIALYHRSDIFCLPTKGDCLPMVLAEAGASGLAVVSTDVGAISDIVRHDDTGLLVPVGDRSALGHALARLVDDAPLRRRLASRMLALVSAEHDAATNARRLVDVARRCRQPVSQVDDGRG